MSAEKLLAEAALWRNAALSAASGVKLYKLTTTRDMRARHSEHCELTSFAPFDNLSRSLVCLLLALECEEDAASERSEEGNGDA